MSNKNFCFVILHYITIQDTIECVESILSNLTYENFQIIIVDNNSPNNTGNELLIKYKNHSMIKVLVNNDNLGFARGNNVGYAFAKYKLNADFIALINNDTIIKQSDFIEQIITKYNLQPFHILGPDIISTVDNKHQNPQALTIQDKDRLIKYINFYKFQLLLNYLGLDKILETAKKKIISKPLVTPAKRISYPWNKEQTNVKLHGSALVFSPDYIKKYEGLNPLTFMYAEESILYFIAQRDNLNMLYFPAIKIYHKEDSSTNSFLTKNYKKRRFYYINFIKSGKVLLGLMRNKSK
ncbi:MAG: glycosyltransferase [Melioribacteraceae bacterium]|nr:glycosyltransferase [Melioribacteraceae bacterium]